MVRGAYRDRTAALAHVKKWYDEILEAEIDGKDPLAPASLAFRHALDMMRGHGESKENIVGYCLNASLALTVNSPNATIWTLIKFMENPLEAETLRGEVDDIMAANGFTTIEQLVQSSVCHDKANMPFLNSAIQETLRMCTMSMSLRLVTKDAVLPVGDGIQLKKGQTLMCQTRPGHFSEANHEDAKTWKPERFMPVWRKLMGLDAHPFYQPYGGGRHLCEGELIAQPFSSTKHVLTTFHSVVVRSSLCRLPHSRTRHLLDIPIQPRMGR